MRLYTKESYRIANEKTNIHVAWRRLVERERKRAHVGHGGERTTVTKRRDLELVRWRCSGQKIMPGFNFNSGETIPIQEV